MLMQGVSVIICCYNSAWIIERCLDSLARQIIPDNFGWEVIVVDNLCTDNTVDIVKKIKDNTTITIHIVEEKTPGLLNARKKGIQKAAYYYSIYCDDDNILSEDYVYGMYKIMSSDHKIGCAGGMGLPVYMAAPEPAILSFSKSYALGSQKASFGLFGAGLCVQTQLVKEIYSTQKFYLTGRCGSQLLAGDDSELVASILIRGYKKAASDELTFKHYLSPQRLTWNYLCKMKKGFALSHPILLAMEYAIKGKPPIYIYVPYVRSYLVIIKKILFVFDKQKRLIVQNNFDIIKAYHYWGFMSLLNFYNDFCKYKK